MNLQISGKIAPVVASSKGLGRALVLIALASLVLGMGLPVTAAWWVHTTGLVVLSLIFITSFRTSRKETLALSA